MHEGNRTVASALSLLFPVLLLLSLTGCPDAAPDATETPVAVTGVVLDSDSVSVGTTWQLTATVAPADAANTAASWSSSDASKATVSDTGLVTALVDAGTVTITVTTTDGGFTDTCTVSLRAPDVYVTGFYYYFTGDSMLGEVGYWKNGVWHALPLQADLWSAMVEAIHVFNGGVHAAGAQVNADGWSTAGYWKDDAWNPLDKIIEDGHTDPHGIHVDGSTVLVVGTAESTTGMGAETWPVYWVNGVLNEIPRDPTDTSWGMNALNVVGSDVYISGSCQGDTYGYRLGYWKNNVWVTLPAHNSGETVNLNAVTSDGNNVHACGQTYPWPPYAIIWTNGTSAALSGTSTVTSVGRDIAVSGGSVYVAGYYLPTNSYPATPCYWKDNALTSLGMPAGADSNARMGDDRIHVAVWNGTVYVAGSVSDGSTTGIPCLWTNGALTELPATASRDYVVSDVSLY